MSKLLRTAAWLVLLAALALWGLTALGIVEQDVLAGMLDDAKRIGGQAEQSVNQFIEDSGLKEGAEDAAQKAAEWLEGAADAAEGAVKKATPETV